MSSADGEPMHHESYEHGYTIVKIVYESKWLSLNYHLWKYNLQMQHMANLQHPNSNLKTNALILVYINSNFNEMPTINSWFITGSLHFINILNITHALHVSLICT